MNLSRLAIRRAPSRRLTGFILFSGILLASIIIRPFHREVFTICLLQDVFGIPCPGCGITRAFLFLGHGDLRSALALNANSLLIFSMVVLFWLHSAFTAITHNEIKIRLMRYEAFILAALAVAATAAGWIYNVKTNPWV